jgi:hypothetical protein
MLHAIETETNDAKRGLRASLESMLAKWGITGPQERACARAIEKALPDPVALASLAAGPRTRLGEMLCSVGRIELDQVAEALAEQGRTGERLGDLLVRHGHMSAAERDVAIKFQEQQQAKRADVSPLRLGEILVAIGKLTPAGLNEALARQRSSGRRLGEELVAGSYATQADIDTAIATQKKLVAIAFTLAMTAAAGAPVSALAQQAPARARSSVKLVVRIPVVARMRTLSQGEAVTVTAADIQRGFVEVPAGSRFELVANSAHTVHFAAQGAWFSAVKVSGLGGDLMLGPTGGEFLQPLRLAGPEIHQLNYRFDLSPQAVPGRYAWPLSLSVSSA